MGYSAFFQWEKVLYLKYGLIIRYLTIYRYKRMWQLNLRSDDFLLKS